MLSSSGVSSARLRQMSTRWQDEGGGRASYDEAWKRLEASGHNPHGEADLVVSLGPTSVFDAGCGTGRVAIELARRGLDVVGVDLDVVMLGQAQVKAPELRWVRADLAVVDLGRSFDAVVMAGNVILFVAPGTEAQVIANLARHLAPGGVLIAGFQLRAGGFGIDQYDAAAAAAGLALGERWATWDRQPWRPGGDYAVSAHRAAG
jgi:SAM-dependent methyltransferase